MRRIRETRERREFWGKKKNERERERDSWFSTHTGFKKLMVFELMKETHITRIFDVFLGTGRVMFP
jgi:hypothetical protein